LSHSVWLSDACLGEVTRAVVHNYNVQVLMYFR